MKGEEAKVASLVANDKGTVHAKGKVEHKQPFKNDINRYFF